MRPPAARFTLNFFLPVVIVACLCTIHRLGAQINTEAGITKVEPQIVTTPNFSGPIQKGGRPKSWLEIEISFATALPTPATGVAEQYSDDLTLNYYVLLANKSALCPQGTLLTGQTPLISVPLKQSDLKSVIYVSPKGLERFFNGKIPSSANAAVTDIGITISKSGQVIAEKSLKSSGAWWSSLKPVSGYLLNRSETPFSSLNWDYYEMVKKQ